MITIHRKGWTNANMYKVEGKVIDAQGRERFEI
jgi:hypothetical protein